MVEFMQFGKKRDKTKDLSNFWMRKSLRRYFEMLKGIILIIMHAVSKRRPYGS
jgi:hypothetical protein